VVVEEQAVDALLAEATVTDATVSFEEFMRPEAPAGGPDGGPARVEA
jgi:hypothetical protein